MAVTTINKIVVPAGALPAALGDIRRDLTVATFDLDTLRRATTEPNVYPNPNKSPGCSPILRAFLIQTGLPFGISKEISNDGNRSGHQSGNALDIIPASTSVNTAAALEDLSDIIVVAAPMFTRISYVDVEIPSYSITQGSVDAALAASTHNSIHIESNAATIQGALSNHDFRTALLARMNTTTTFAMRGVNYDNTTTTHNRASNSAQDGNPSVNFW